MLVPQLREGCPRRLWSNAEQSRDQGASCKNKELQRQPPILSARHRDRGGDEKQEHSGSLTHSKIGNRKMRMDESGKDR